MKDTNIIERLRKFSLGGSAGLAASTKLMDSTNVDQALAESDNSLLPYFIKNPYDYIDLFDDDDEEEVSESHENSTKKTYKPYTYNKKTKKSYTLSAGLASENRTIIINTLMQLGLDSVTATALAILAGAESSYNPAVANGGGIGQWIKAHNIRQNVLDHINEKNGTAYTSLIDVPLELQAEALKWSYYDKHLSLVDSKTSLYDKVEIFAKIGLSPTMADNGHVSWNGNPYQDTPEGWFAYLTDTGNNPKNQDADWDAHVARRIKNAGFTLSA